MQPGVYSSLSLVELFETTQWVDGFVMINKYVLKLLTEDFVCVHRILLQSQPGQYPQCG